MADAHLLNLRDAFDVSNPSKAGPHPARVPWPKWAQASWPTAAQWCEQVAERVNARLAHIFFLARMPNPHEAATTAAKAEVMDADRIDQLFAFLEAGDPRPVFAHIHLMGSHGGWFDVEQQHWSAGREQSKAWDADFLDDAIRDFDRNVERVYQRIESSGQLAKTLLVVSSDHGIYWNAGAELPLLIRWPETLKVAPAQRRGALPFNTQRIDIAPTLLDALALPKPDWMSGTSLLDEALVEDRPIFGAAVNFSPGKKVPGFGRLASVTLAQCRERSRLVLASNEIRRERGAQAVLCSSHDAQSDEALRGVIDAFLQQHGYSAAR